MKQSMPRSMQKSVRVMVLTGVLIGAALGVFATGCQRSPAYKRDQDYTNSSDQGMSYYTNRTAAAKTPTQRIESMGQPKKRVVVFNFWNDTPVKTSDLGTFAADELRRGLFATERLILPEEARTELSTSDFIQGERIKTDQLIREGRRMGVAVLVIGRISKIIFRQRGDEIGLLRQKQSMAGVDIELKVFDVAAGREIMATARSGDAASNSLVAFEGGSLESAEYRAELTRLAARKAVALLVPEVVKSVEKMAWQGRIAKVSGPKIYVNAGRASGIVGGDILKVLTTGDDIYDPTTGAYLGKSQGQLKGTLEVVDFLGTDGAVTEVHTGGNFQEGDLVQLY